MNTYPGLRAQLLARKDGLDIDKSGDYDCVDIAKAKSMADFPQQTWQETGIYGNAKDIFNNANPKYWQKFLYRSGQPQAGDIICFAPTPAPGYTNQTVNKNGHVGLLDATGSDSYTLLMQESGTGLKPFLQTKAWNYRPCIGFLRPQGEPMLNEGDVTNMYFNLLGHPADDATKKSWAGHTFKELFYAILDSDEYKFRVANTTPQVVVDGKPYVPKA